MYTYTNMYKRAEKTNAIVGGLTGAAIGGGLSYFTSKEQDKKKKYRDALIAMALGGLAGGGLGYMTKDPWFGKKVEAKEPELPAPSSEPGVPAPSSETGAPELPAAESPKPKDTLGTANANSHLQAGATGAQPAVPATQASNQAPASEDNAATGASQSSVDRGGVWVITNKGTPDETKKWYPPLPDKPAADSTDDAEEFNRIKGRMDTAWLALKKDDAELASGPFRSSPEKNPGVNGKDYYFRYPYVNEYNKTCGEMIQFLDTHPAYRQEVVSGVNAMQQHKNLASGNPLYMFLDRHKALRDMVTPF